MNAHEMDLVSTEPPAVRVRVVQNGDSVRVTFDEAANIVEIGP